MLIPDRFTKLNVHGKDVLLITKHQTTGLDKNSVALIKFLLNRKKTEISELFNLAKENSLDIYDTRNLIKKLIISEAVKIK